MKILFAFLFFITFKNSDSLQKIVVIPNYIHPDYCKKIDTLIQERYIWKPEFDRYSDRIINEIEIKTKIKGTCQYGFTGKIYCDTLFNEDVRKWSKYFNCSISLPKARPKLMCDPIIMNDDIRNH
jgi:hypothetical protein